MKMQCSGNPDFHQKSFRLNKHEGDKFFTRLLTKETSISNHPSFRVYYGDVSSTVPFTWETTPGTPKHKSSENSHIPPLTPPPSYYSAALHTSSGNRSKSKILLQNLLRRMNPSKKWSIGSSLHSSSSLSTLSWSSAHSSFSDPAGGPVGRRKRLRFSSWGSSFDARSTVSKRGETRCFRINLTSGGCSVLTVKKALLSIVGRGSG